MDEEKFKEYIKEVRFFYEQPSDSYPTEVMLMRAYKDIFVTRCAVIPVSMVGETKGYDLTDWFNNHYKEVYNYLKDNDITLY